MTDSSSPRRGLEDIVLDVAPAQLVAGQIEIELRISHCVQAPGGCQGGTVVGELPPLVGARAPACRRVDPAGVGPRGVDP